MRTICSTEITWTIMIEIENNYLTISRFNDLLPLPLPMIKDPYALHVRFQGYQLTKSRYRVVSGKHHICICIVLTGWK